MTEREQAFFDEWIEQVRSLGPVVRGSLCMYRRNCGKPACRKCASGQGHPTWQLSYYSGRRHTTCHVGPGQLENVRAVIEGWRGLERLLNECGAKYIKMLKGK